MQRKEKYAIRRAQLADERQKKKKNKQRFLFLLALLFVPPLLLFPAMPRSAWEYNLYQMISQDLHITIGANGPLPFFTMLSSLYTSVYALLLMSYWSMQFIRTHGLGQQFQQQYYELLFDYRSKHAEKFPLMDHPVFKKICISLLFIIALVIGVFHFVLDDVSLPSSSRRGALFELMYNFKLGVISAELLMSLIYWAPIFYFLFLLIYIINLVRGLEAGKCTVPMPKSQPKKRQKRK